MSKSTHQIAVKAVDKTGPAFASIQATAAAASAHIRSMMGGAIAAAGAYLGMSAVKGGIDELGKLSDIAMKTSTSVDELTRGVAALNVLGIQNMSVENLAKSFDYMAKTTGRAGMEGFYQTIGELGKIPDAAQRGQEAMKIFGRSGMEFMPLINAAKDGTAALEQVVAAMPGIPDAAANAGDAAADAMLMSGNAIKSIWLQVLGKISAGADDTFDGDIRGAAAAGVGYLEYYLKVAWRHVVAFFANFGLGWQAISADWGTTFSKMTDAWISQWKACFEFVVEEAKNLGAMFRDFGKEIWSLLSGDGFNWDNVFANTNFKGVLNKFTDDFTAAASSIDLFDNIQWASANTDDLEENLRRKIDLAKGLKTAVDDAAISLARRKERDAAAEKEAASKAPQIRNELMLGGSNASLRAAVIGPQLQNETKKQTKILEKIASNTTPSKNTEENFNEI